VNPASFDSTPSEVGIGTLRLHGWQARRVTPLPVTCEPYDGYLIKAGYDLEIEPGAQAPSWFEIGFALGGFIPDGSPEHPVACGGTDCGCVRLGRAGDPLAAYRGSATSVSIRRGAR
jgi:hypothetical protein